MLDVAGTVLFITFVLAAVQLWVPAPATVRRLQLNVLLAVVILGSGSAGLAQRNLWPFSSWPLVAGTLEDQVTFGRLLAVDGRGDEYEVDYRAWQPLAFDELMSWVDFVYPTLDPDAQRQAGAELLRLAETARRKARAGERLGGTQRFFGPVAAPYFILHPRRWTDPTSVPGTQFERVRYVRETWHLSTWRGRAEDRRRAVVFEYPPQ
jgi:hypothetical protein